MRGVWRNGKIFSKRKNTVNRESCKTNILNLEGKRERGLEQFGLNGDKKVVLVIGGSLGARTINESILRCLDTFDKSNIQLIWQTGKGFFEIAKQAVTKYESKELKHLILSKRWIMLTQ